MKPITGCAAALAGLLATSALSATQEVQDPYIWLEDIRGEQALDWVHRRSQASLDVLTAHPDFETIYQRNRAIYDSRERIPTPEFEGNYLYNLWQDEAHVRGVWRRTNLRQYRGPSPRWQVMLDLDSLADAEGENWVWNGATCLHPDHLRCMIRLSRGGGDAVVFREFDVSARAFVEDGFVIPEAKGQLAWINRNTLFVSTDFGEGTLTQSGYPRIVKVWQRGTPLETATTIFEGDTADVGVSAQVFITPERPYALISRATTFYDAIHYVVESGQVTELTLPPDAEVEGFFKNQLLVRLRSNLQIGATVHPLGSLLGIDFDRLLDRKREYRRIFVPDARSTIQSVILTWDYVLVNTLTDVRSELLRYQFLGGGWRGDRVDLPESGTMSIGTADEESNRFFFTYTDFLTPNRLYLANGGGDSIELVKSLPAFFDTQPLIVEQYETPSADGTMIPYSVVRTRNLELDGRNPTLLYGYGGFEIPNLPRYNPTLGASWLERGGVYVSANIRGGGEFGPAWHQAAIGKNRQHAYDDFIAVAEDLVARGITSPQHLGIMGGSNGGLLVGAVFTQRPELFNAVVSRVPLLDMRRYHLLLAGASWMGEYGNPDLPDDWEYLSAYSPYHNVSADREYPPVFFSTSTQDDRVHPGHARKMVAKMDDMGHDVFYYENTEGGHAAASNNEQRAFADTLIYTYLLRQLRDGMVP